MDRTGQDSFSLSHSDYPAIIASLIMITTSLPSILICSLPLDVYESASESERATQNPVVPSVW